jgi:hypothetical protein
MEVVEGKLEVENNVVLADVYGSTITRIQLVLLVTKRSVYVSHLAFYHLLTLSPSPELKLSDDTRCGQLCDAGVVRAQLVARGSKFGCPLPLHTLLFKDVTYPSYKYFFP